MVSLPMFQDGSQAIQANYNTKGEDQAYGGKHDVPQSSSPSIIRCYKCQGEGHIARECPQRRSNVILCDGPCAKNMIEYEVENDCDEPKVRHDDTTLNVDDEQLKKDLNPSCELNQIMGDLSKEELDQSVNLFHARFKMIDRVCSLVIDGRSSTNMVSCSMVDRMKLPTQTHPKPYKLQWLIENDEVEVTKQVVMNFSIGKYRDEVICDVLPLQSYHMLFGRP